MITRENIIEVIKNLSNKDKKRLKNTSKEYAVLRLHCFNVGCIIELILTNDFIRYQNVSNEGNCILDTNDSIFNNIK